MTEIRCAGCNMPIRQDDDVWVDDSGGDACTVDDGINPPQETVHAAPRYTFVDEGMGYVTVLDAGGNPQEYQILRADAEARYPNTPQP